MGLIQLLSDADDLNQGIVETMHHDPYEDIMVVKKEQDYSSILKNNKALANDGDGYTPSKNLRRVASIPNIVVETWMKEGINIFNKDDWPKVAAKLDDPENRFLRTAPGKVSKKPVREYYTTTGVNHARKLR